MTLQAIPGPLACVLPEFWGEPHLGQRRFFWLDHRIRIPDLGTRFVLASRPSQLTAVRLPCSVPGWGGGQTGGRFPYWSDGVVLCGAVDIGATHGKLTTQVDTYRNGHG